MARNIKKRIEVNGGEGLWVGLGGALEKLDLGKLPAGPSEAEVVLEEGGVAKRAKKMGRVVLRREKAHRGGKTVIVIEGFGEHLGDEEIAGVGKRLRVGCGCGCARCRREEVLSFFFACGVCVCVWSVPP